MRRLTQDPERLFRWRVRKGWTQERLGREAGVTKSTISRAERGLVSVEVETLHALATALGCRVDDLMPVEGE